MLRPRIDSSVFMTDGVHVVGDVRLAAKVNIWFGSVLRGDVNFIEVGEGTNIQDQSMLHVNDDAPCRVGRYVTIGHRVTLHGCTVEDNCLLGMGSIVLDDAVVGEGSLIAAGSLVTQGTVVPPNSLVMGIPGKVKRPLKPDENPAVPLAHKYIELAQKYLNGEFGS